MTFKLLRSALLLSALALGATQAQAEKLTIAATQVPHAEILEVVKPVLAKEGVELDIKVFSDYVQPNLQVADKQLDANFFQHKPYLDSFNKDRKTSLVPVALVHVEPFGAYSKKIKKLDELKTGASVAIPNDPSNSGRALVLLQKQGLIKLKDPSNILATPVDVVENPKKLKFRELEAAMLPRSLDDVDLALINTNYALEAGLVPTKDALFIEGSDSPYANIVVTREDNKDAPAVKKLVQALHSDAVRKFIVEKYKGAVVPAF
ncbi:MetQ/NlpA family ABC transporter substrate-binding protein [Bordetella hinzii]|uniref:MetQ/NlpA family lipoprotein n=1 Tax=Bordetella hinzii TaxID=103855 RepID=A0AAN1VG11_9BORD|nr:MetQ/NlpA family ABC transporter substrate-binding protein [Bordetella hinzii]AKQ57547.1 D-methionine-binding lipoprotein MetQ precursor [Bordetella hinzii]AKQ62013.1 D-methionine-binding lipoprotein MetQ precursor [Bordetella hinzii]AZW17067.1 MetQ/NlpA family lipoprotein [Bordetella hinzii]KCB27834.1 lipoprotein, YaeC family [Bordetella hinzii L60]KCB29925.1 lipoprotein, YaeC family [Bordetella hinzii CA90 BAL1384]